MTDDNFLQQALAEAAVFRGVCAPNPAVGAVLVKAGKVIGVGAHAGPGKGHAEVLALQGITGDLSTATLYVTLEPCCHHGRTPPCTDLIIACGVGRVIFSEQDPNPAVSGKGQAKLKAADILCERLSVPAIQAFYQSYRQWWQTGLPFVTAKLAMTRTGAIAEADGSPLAITGLEFSHFTHQARAKADGILTTVKTILSDNPRFNARLEDKVIAKPLYVLDTKARLPVTAKVWETAKSLTVFYGETADAEAVARLQRQGGVCIAVPERRAGLDILAVMRQLGELGLHDLWVEAGGQCLSSLLQAGLVHRLILGFGGGACSDAEKGYRPFLRYHTASQLTDLQWSQAGADAILTLSMRGG